MNEKTPVWHSPGAREEKEHRCHGPLQTPAQQQSGFGWGLRWVELCDGTASESWQSFAKHPEWNWPRVVEKLHLEGPELNCKDSLQTPVICLWSLDISLGFWSLFLCNQIDLLGDSLTGLLTYLSMKLGLSSHFKRRYMERLQVFSLLKAVLILLANMGER